MYLLKIYPIQLQFFFFKVVYDKVDVEAFLCLELKNA